MGRRAHRGVRERPSTDGDHCRADHPNLTYLRDIDHDCRRYPTDTSDAFAIAAEILFSNFDWW